MLVEYRKFNSKRRFGIELEVSSVQKAKPVFNRNCIVKGGCLWRDKDGQYYPYITKDLIRGIIEKASPRSVEVVGTASSTDWEQTSQNDYWHVKYDSTCGPLGKKKDQGGWEVASYIAQGQRDLLHIASVADALRYWGVEVNDNCGLHIHAEAADFSPSQVAILIARWLKIEPWICQILPRHRRSNKYCRPLTKYLKGILGNHYIRDAQLLWHCIKPTNLNPHENSQKKVSINIVNYVAAYKAEEGCYDYDRHRKTLEFRMPEGTLIGTDIINWGYLYLMFVELSKNAALPAEPTCVPTLEDFLQYFGLESTEGVYLLSEELFELKKWILKRMIQWGNQRYVKEAQKKLKLMEL